MEVVMCYLTRLPGSGSPPCVSPSGSSHLAVWRVLLCVWLVAAGILALAKTCRAQTFNMLYSFSVTNNAGINTDGAYPYAGLIQARDGSLYGTTFSGGTNGHGTVFQITTGGTLTTLHSFIGTDGDLPAAGLIQASDGNL